MAIGKLSPSTTFLLKQSFVFLWTLLLIAFFLAIVKFFQNRGFPNRNDPTVTNLDEPRKIQYAGLSTALGLLLGLSAADGFKTLATVAPRTILEWMGFTHHKSPSSHEKTIILNERIAKWSSVPELIYHSAQRPWKPRILFACIAWLALFLATTICVALLSTAVVMTDGTTFADVYPTENALVRFPNLTCHFHWNYDAEIRNCPLDTPDPSDLDLATSQFLAHNYGNSGWGDITETTECTSYDTHDDVLNAQLNSSYIPLYYCLRTH